MLRAGACMHEYHVAHGHMYPMYPEYCAAMSPGTRACKTPSPVIRRGLQLRLQQRTGSGGGQECLSANTPPSMLERTMTPGF